MILLRCRSASVPAYMPDHWPASTVSGPRSPLLAGYESLLHSRHVSTAPTPTTPQVVSAFACCRLASPARLAGRYTYRRSVPVRCSASSLPARVEYMEWLVQSCSTRAVALPGEIARRPCPNLGLAWHLGASLQSLADVGGPSGKTGPFVTGSFLSASSVNMPPNNALLQLPDASPCRVLATMI